MPNRVYLIVYILDKTLKPRKRHKAERQNKHCVINVNIRLN